MRMFETLCNTRALLVCLPQALTATPFIREPVCANSHKRVFETLFKIGALLVHSPQAHD